MKYSLLFLLVPLMWPSEFEKNPGAVSFGTSASAFKAEAEPIHHVFFHPLIAYPELAFDGDEHQEQMDAWFVTVSEFLKTLDSLYKNGFVLVDIREAYRQDERGLPVSRKLPLPPGKKPLVLSIDDLNYYEYMKKNGTVHRLFVNASGQLAEYTDLPGRPGEVSYDRSIPNLLESFLRIHPDFSHNGARGIIALTGYNGIFGYRTHDLRNSAYPRDKAEALKTAEKLKELGWSFCSHSYYHRKLGQMTAEELKRDTERWKAEVGAFVGESNVLIYPFGSRLSEGSENFAYLRSQGFSVFLGTSNQPFEKNVSGAVVAYRLPVDGKAFRGCYGDLSRFFDAESVIDPMRKLSNVKPGQAPPH